MAPVQVNEELDVKTLKEQGFEEEAIKSVVRLYFDNECAAVLAEHVEFMNYDTLNVAREVIPEERQKAIAVAAANKQIDILKDYDGLIMELKGTWLWIKGNTKTHKEALKMLGCRYCGDKKVWVYKSKLVAKKSGRPSSMSYINRKYGTQVRQYGSDPTPDDNN